MMRNHGREKVNDEFIFNTRKRKIPVGNILYQTKSSKNPQKRGKGKVRQEKWRNYYNRKTNPIVVKEIKILNKLFLLLRDSYKELSKRRKNYLLDRIKNLHERVPAVFLQSDNTFFKWVSMNEVQYYDIIGRKKKS